MPRSPPSNRNATHPRMEYLVSRETQNNDCCVTISYEKTIYKASGP